MDFRQRYMVKPGKRYRIDDRDPDDVAGFDDKKTAKALTAEKVAELARLQYKLYADNTRSVLVILQALDAGGKDGTINHVFAALNPQGCRVQSFKVPTAEELAHDFLWRIHRVAPKKGEFVIFNRSHYERVLVERVQKLITMKACKESYRYINDFEELLTSNGTKVVKFFLHISREEQLKRFNARLDDPEKHWKISLDDYTNRQYWDDYKKAFEDVFEHCNSEDSPWYVIPSNRKYFRNLAIASIVVDAVHDLKLELPAPRVDLDEARRMAQEALAEEAERKKNKKDA